MIGNFDIDCCNTFNNTAKYGFGFVILRSEGGCTLINHPQLPFPVISPMPTHTDFGRKHGAAITGNRQTQKSLAILVNLKHWDTHREMEEVEMMPLLCSALTRERDMQGGREQLAVYYTIWPLLGTVYTQQEGILAPPQSQNPFHWHCSAVTFTYSS